MRCKECKKRGGIGGSAVTKYVCIKCATESLWGNTNHPNLCSKCMKEAQSNNKICVWCGKEINELDKA